MTSPRRFRKNPRIVIVIVPGHGRVHDVDILVGDQYAQYAPHLLHEVGVAEPTPVFPSVPAAAAVPALHDALAIAARETVPVADPAPPTSDPAPPTSPEPVSEPVAEPAPDPVPSLTLAPILVLAPTPAPPAIDPAPVDAVESFVAEVAVVPPRPEAEQTPLPTEPEVAPSEPASQPESDSAKASPVDTLNEAPPEPAPAPVKNKGGRPRKVKPTAGA